MHQVSNWQGTSERAELPRELLDNISVRDEEKGEMRKVLDRILNETGIINLNYSDMEHFFQRKCEYATRKVMVGSMGDEISQWIDAKVSARDSVMAYFEGEVDLKICNDLLGRIEDKIQADQEGAGRESEIVFGVRYEACAAGKEPEVNLCLWVRHPRIGHTNEGRKVSNNPAARRKELEAEAQRCLQEFLEEAGQDVPTENDLPIPQGEQGEPVIYLQGKTAMRRGGQKSAPSTIRIHGFVGSPLYIALHLKRYEEAARILESDPLSAAPGYAALPVTIHYSRQEKAYAPPEITYHVDQAIYLEDLALLDKGIPAELFRMLCAELAKRKQTELIDLPCRYERLIRKRASQTEPGIEAAGRSVPKLPALLLELPGRYSLKNEEKNDTEAVKKDMELLRKAMKGLYRLKALDESLYRKWVDEHTAAHLFLWFCNRFMNLYMVAVDDDHVVKQEVEPEHFREVLIPFNGQEQLLWMRKTMHKLGMDTVSADLLWDAFADYEYGFSPKANIMWLRCEIWKDVFGQKLVFTVEERRNDADGSRSVSGVERDTRGIELLNALLHFENRLFLPCREKNIQYHYYLPRENLQESKIFLELLDWIHWKSEAVSEGEIENFRRQRRAMAQSVLKTGDKELMLLCLEKNVFPAEDGDFLYEKLQEEEGEVWRDYYPMLVMKKHGCWKEK